MASIVDDLHLKKLAAPHIAIWGGTESDSVSAFD
jgi:hypothetical protein